MLSATRVAFIGAISAHFAHAFSPVFSVPRQCESLHITWSEIDLPTVDMSLSEVLFELIPLDTDPSRVAPEPYLVSVPSGGHKAVMELPFPGGTQFFASAHMLGSAGFTRRTVSTVFTVEHSEKTDCLPSKAIPADGRAKVKSFGKRQINVVGTGVTPATGVPAPVNAVVSPSSSSSASAPAASSSSGAPPPIRVIGTSNIPASGAPDTPPANAAPAPAFSSGAVPPIQVIGTSFVTATGDASSPSSSSTDSSAESSPTSTDSVRVQVLILFHCSTEADTTSTSCTDTSTALPVETQTSEEMPPATITMPEQEGYGDGYQQDEQPCEESMDSSEHQSMHETTTVTQTYTATAALPAATETVNTEVVHYTAFDEMVNAANSMFKAWNPYMPAYTPSAGN
ncbi:hypothetical protein M408DRAFT_13939 [Serendipita vermifera MAFF 305830]|uniref:Uncharacterized protein n=1 Tax=Serendipita vermifera MAFF 305830 TaxID=933852 RepID=A0A0C3BQQ5_SERVB|nr:hypothetical protein M408DRAFT_13939 [Serendipita vermifera MAFF 305830]